MSKRILCVHEDDETCKTLTEPLARLGHEVTNTLSISRALYVATTQHFDLFIIDRFNLDRVGLDVCRKIRQISPAGDEHEVMVRIDEEAVGYVERMTRRRLPAESSFWTIQAQRVLSDYLWKEGAVPPAGSLTVRDVDRAELPVAARW